MTSATINQILGITESYQLPEMLLKTLLDDPSQMMDKFMELGESLDHDWFTEYFEEEHANKSKMAQDFTPPEVCDLLAHVVGNATIIGDVCAGTGGLTIGICRKNPMARFVCYEYSERALPLLLFNLAIRNLDAYVCRCDILTGEEFDYFRIAHGEKYGEIMRIDSMPEVKCDAIVSNPPYSQKYNPKADKRFPKYAYMLPSNFADYVFVAFALSILGEGGKAGFILPHGVLFRGNKEALFRKMLLERGAIRSIIGLPNKLFIATDIPTCIMELQTDRKDRDVLFINADQQFEKAGRKNLLRPEHIQRICDAYDKRADIERFAHLASAEELEKNSFNCNIPRYVDTFIPEPVPDFVETLTALGGAEKEAVRTRKALLEMVGRLYGTTAHTDEEFKKGLRAYKRILMETEDVYEQMVMDLES